MIEIGNKFKYTIVDDESRIRTKIYEVIEKKGSWWILRDFKTIDEPPFPHLDYDNLPKYNIACRYDKEEETLYTNNANIGGDGESRFYFDRF